VPDKPPIFFINAVYPPALQDLEQRFTVFNYRDAPDPTALIAAAAGAGVRAVYTNGSNWIPDTVDWLPALKLVACTSTGYDEFDLDVLTQRGVTLTHSPELTSTDVADLAMTLLLGASRRVTWAERYVRSGDWVRLGKPPLTRRMSGKRLGIVGLGAIGRKIAARAAGFEMEIAYHGPRRKDGVPYRYYPDLVDMARDVDYLAVACIGGPATENIVHAGVLAALGPEGIVVNVARGTCIEGEALLAALRDGTIGGAGLDCHPREPMDPAAYAGLDNVVLTPHFGSGTPETRKEMSDLAIRNLEAFFAGAPLLSVIPEMAGD
jgi:hydroxypyruvate reductase